MAQAARGSPGGSFRGWICNTLCDQPFVGNQDPAADSAHGRAIRPASQSPLHRHSERFQQDCKRRRLSRSLQVRQVCWISLRTAFLMVRPNTSASSSSKCLIREAACDYDLDLIARNFVPPELDDLCKESALLPKNIMPYAPSHILFVCLPSLCPDILGGKNKNHGETALCRAEFPA